MPRRYSNIFTDRINSFNNTDYHKQFWTGFRIFFTTSIISEVGFFQKPFDNLFDPYTQNDDSISSYSGFTFLNIGSGRFNSTLWLIGWIHPKRSQVAAKLCVDRNNNQAQTLFEKLNSDKDNINDLFGDTLNWEAPPIPSVGIYINDVENDDWINGIPHLYQWLYDNLIKLNKVFSETLARYYIDSLNNN